MKYATMRHRTSVIGHNHSKPWLIVTATDPNSATLHSRASVSQPPMHSCKE